MSWRAPRFFRIDDTRPFTGWHALVLIGLFFAVIIIVNIVMAVYANSTFPGLVVKNGYVASQQYNEVLAGARAQAESGLRAEIGHERGVVSFRLLDRDGFAVHGLTVTALAGRPATAREDIVIAFAETGDGYVADGPLGAGRWEVEIEARRGGGLAYRELREVFVSPAEAP